MLHRARAERIEPGVDRIILLRQPGEVAHHLRLAKTRQADRALPLEAAEARSATGGGSGRSTPQWPGRILLEDQRLLDLQPAIAADRLGRLGMIGRRARAHRLAPIAHRSTSRSPASSRSISSSVVSLGRRDQQQIGQLGAARIEPADRHAGEDASLGQRVDDRRRRDAAGARANSLKKAAIDELHARDRASRSASATAAAWLRRASRVKPGLAEQRQVDREGQRAQAGIGADVARRLLAADMLLAGRQGQHPAAPPLGIDRLADQPPGHLPDEFVAAWRTARHRGRRN